MMQQTIKVLPFRLAKSQGWTCVGCAIIIDGNSEPVGAFSVYFDNILHEFHRVSWDKKFNFLVYAVWLYIILLQEAYVPPETTFCCRALRCWRYQPNLHQLNNKVFDTGESRNQAM
jgi:hypothetical protein